jgi:uncharacterized protein YkwD
MMLSVLLLLASMVQPEVRVPALEKQIFERVNEERGKAKLPPLKLVDVLSDIARAHSNDMAEHGYMAHVNPAGLGPTERARAAGFTCQFQAGRRTYRGIAENIFQNNLYSGWRTVGSKTVYDWNSEEKIAMTSVAGWMASPGHRANILNPNATRTGVGISFSSDRKVLITQVFC